MPENLPYLGETEEQFTKRLGKVPLNARQKALLRFSEALEGAVKSGPQAGSFGALRAQRSDPREHTRKPRGVDLLSAPEAHGALPHRAIEYPDMVSDAARTIGGTMLGAGLGMRAAPRLATLAVGPIGGGAAYLGMGLAPPLARELAYRLEAPRSHGLITPGGRFGEAARTGRYGDLPPEPTLEAIEAEADRRALEGAWRREPVGGGITDTPEVFWSRSPERRELLVRLAELEGVSGGFRAAVEHFGPRLAAEAQTMVAALDQMESPQLGEWRPELGGDRAARLGEMQDEIRDVWDRSRAAMSPDPYLDFFTESELDRIARERALLEE